MPTVPLRHTEHAFTKVRQLLKNLGGLEELQRRAKQYATITRGTYIPFGAKKSIRELRPHIRETPVEMAEAVLKDVPGAKVTTKGMHDFLKALALGGGFTLGGLGIGEIISTVKEKGSDLFQDKAFEAMLKVNPKLPLLNLEKVRLYFDTLWKFGPDLAKDPLTAGSVVHQAMQMDVSGGPPIDQIKTVVDIQHRRQQTQRGAGTLSEFLTEAGKKQIVGLYG